MRCLLFKKCTLILAILLAFSNVIKSQSTLVWGRQFGSDKEEYALNHVMDKEGNIYIAGKTTGIIADNNLGKNDGFLTKFDNSGKILWSRQFGTTEDEDIQWCAIDSSENIYITGSTRGDLGHKNFGKEDIFIAKYNKAGKLIWIRQFGTDSTDVAKGIFADKNGNIFVTGYTLGKLGQEAFGKSDGFLMKLDPDGRQLYTTQFGSSADDYSYALTGNSNSEIYLCGSTWGAFNGKNNGFIDGFVGEFSDHGKPVNFFQFGSNGFDIAMNLALDEDNNIYIGGTTSGNMGAEQLGEGDAFMLKMNIKGEVKWKTQFGTTNNDGIRSLTYNPKVSQNIFVSGVKNLPPANGFIRAYTKTGEFLWERDILKEGMTGDASGKDVSVDDEGNIYHLGLTHGNIFGSKIGGIYLIKLKIDKSYSQQ
jgi:hypothetical protein